MIHFRKTLISVLALAALAGAIAASVALAKVAPPYTDILAMKAFAAAPIGA